MTVDTKIENTIFYHSMKTGVISSLLREKGSPLRQSISYELKTKKIKDNDSFYRAIDGAIGHYEISKRVDNEYSDTKKNFTGLNNTTNKLITQLNDFSWYTDLLFESSECVNRPDLVKRLQELNNHTELIIDYLSRQRPEKKKEGPRPDQSKQELFIEVANAIEDTLGIKPSKTKDGVFDSIMLLILNELESKELSNIHGRTMKSLNERKENPKPWTVIRFKINKKLGSFFSS